MAWEYKTVEGITKEKMNELGLERWELVKIEELGGEAIFKRRIHYPHISETNWDPDAPHGPGWYRKHPDD